ncbi:MAG: polyribonucleotide nucleotidyltransferase, partial [Candidatus Muiribacteriota bacterium]
MKEIVVEKIIDGNSFKLSTGKIAKQADGAVIAQSGETMVFASACASSNQSGFAPFFPLTVEFREKTYAAGKIPGGFFKREGKPSSAEVLCARSIDRPLRPLFDDGFKAETQVIVNVLSYDQINPYDVMGLNAASAALIISDIPFSTPVAAVRVAKLDGNFVVNPSDLLLDDAELNLDMAGTKEGITMVEGDASQLTEDEVVQALEIGHKYIKELVDLQMELKEKAGKPKREVEKIEPLADDFKKEVEDKISPELSDAVKHTLKLERQEKIKSIYSEHIDPLIEESEDEERMTFLLKELFEDTLKKVVRARIKSEGVRVDGRKLDEIRKLDAEIDILPRAHGSALFTRGETQALGVSTLGTARDEQIIDGLQEEESRKKFLLHYNFPPYCVGEVKRQFSVSRREVGHGNLAERALEQVLPSDEEFPYTIRIVSEVTESNGSSSMASVCAGSLSLMAAGVPVKEQVAGIAMGLIEEDGEYFVLTDILGEEDHFGDMDFKVAGTSNGITAFQMDIKIKSLPLDVMAKALSQAKDARKHILGVMNNTIQNSRKDISKYAPKIVVLHVDPDKIRDIIGPGGKMIKSITEETGVNIDIANDNTGEVKVISPDSEKADMAIKKINSLVRPVQVGDVYENAEVMRVVDFGAFVKITPNKEGLVHISQISKERINKVSDVLSVGDKVKVKVIKIDDLNRINLSMKAVSEE